MELDLGGMNYYYNIRGFLSYMKSQTFEGVTKLNLSLWKVFSEHLLSTVGPREILLLENPLTQPPASISYLHEFFP